MIEKILEIIKKFMKCIFEVIFDNIVYRLDDVKFYLILLKIISIVTFLQAHQ